jgi:hypothetical protein
VQETFQIVSRVTVNCPLFDVQVPQLAKFGKFLAGIHAAEDGALDVAEKRLREELYVVTGVLTAESPPTVSTIRAIQYDTDAKKVSAASPSYCYI